MSLYRKKICTSFLERQSNFTDGRRILFLSLEHFIHQKKYRRVSTFLVFLNPEYLPHAGVPIYTARDLGNRENWGKPQGRASRFPAPQGYFACSRNSNSNFTLSKNATHLLLL